MDYKKLGKKEKYNRIAQALDHMGLVGYGKRKVYTLSGGQQQRVGLARLFLKEANLVLVDEPTASLDDNNANVVISGLKELAKQGAKVVVATHDRAVIQSCDHTYELTEGSN